MTNQRVNIVENILNANDQLAAQNRQILDNDQVFCINLMATPGAGKTTLILKSIEKLAPEYRIGVIEGDTAPVTIDADKVTAVGMPAIQINTGGECHLDAVMVHNALEKMPLKDLDLLLIENVGNLICPAAFQLGSHVNVLIASIPEGDDKPYKYPNIYRGLQALVINKIDLLPYVDFKMDYFEAGVKMLNPGVVTFPLSCKTGEGMESWLTWLEDQIRR